MAQYDLRKVPAGESVLLELTRLVRKDNIPLNKKWLGFSPLTEESQPWYQGYFGEIAVGQRLDRMSKAGWTILHGVPIGIKGSDIDHVAISPEGVIFTINSKHHKNKKIWISEKKILVNGQSVQHVRNSLFEADRVEKLFKRRTVPVISFVNAANIDVKAGAESNGILITTPENIEKILKKANKALVKTGAQYAQDESMLLSTSWSKDSIDLSQDIDDRHDYFKEIKAAQDISKLMRLIYIVLSGAFVLVGISAFLMAFYS